MSPAKKKTAAKKKTPAKKKTAAKKKTPAKKKTAAKKKAPVEKAAPEAKPLPKEKSIVEEALERLPPLSKRIKKSSLLAIREKLLLRREDLAGTLGALESEHIGTHENRTTAGGDEADQANNAQTADISLRLAETGAKAKPRISIVAAHLAIRSRVTGYRKPMTTTAPSFLASRSASANCPSIAGLDA